MDTKKERRHWITSDTHFNHLDKMIEYCNRPINYEQKIFTNLQQIPEQDILIHLGDICIGKDEEMHNKFIVPLKCTKILVKGNHDRKSNNWYLNHGWDFVCSSLILGIESKQVLLIHEPDITRTDFQIHGHYHNTAHRGNFTHKHCFLYAQELFNYKPILLTNLIKTGVKQKNQQNQI